MIFFYCVCHNHCHCLNWEEKQSYFTKTVRCSKYFLSQNKQNKNGITSSPGIQCTLYSLHWKIPFCLWDFRGFPRYHPFSHICVIHILQWKSKNDKNVIHFTFGESCTNIISKHGTNYANKCTYRSDYELLTDKQQFP